MNNKKALTDFIYPWFFSKQHPSSENDQVHNYGKYIMMIKFKSASKVNINVVQRNTPDNIA